MKRFLFVAPGLVGHVTPTVAVAAELQRRGHAVAWAGPLDQVSDRLPAGAAVYTTAGAQAVPRPPGIRGVAALKFLWQDYIVPLAEAMAPGVESAVRRFGADVVVTDQQALAGALVAGRLGLPWATSASTSSELTDPLSAFPKVAAWVDDLIAGLRRQFGRPGADGDPRFSPDLILCYSVPELVPDLAPRLAPAVRFVGSAAVLPAERRPAPRPSRRPLVLVSMGTANTDVSRSFLARAAAALGQHPALRGLIVDPLGAVTDAPRHVLVRPSIPQASLVGRADVVVCHAGHNTVCEALAAGTPLVVAPIRDDQPIVAEQVTSSGCGVRIRFDRADPSRIRDAIDTVLGEPAYREAAGRVGAALRAAGGAASASDHLLALALAPALPGAGTGA